MEGAIRRIYYCVMNFSLKWKLVFIPYFFALVLGIVLIFCYAGISQKEYEKERILSKEDVTRQVAVMAENIQTTAEDLTLYLVTEPETQAFMKNDLVTNPDVSIRLLVSQQYASDIIFFDREGKLLYSTVTDTSVGVVEQRTWDRPLKKLICTEGIFEWEYISRESDVLYEKNMSDKWCLWRVIKDHDTSRPIGGLAFTLNCNKIRNAILPQISEDECIYMMDKSGNIVLWAGTSDSKQTAYVKEAYSKVEETSKNGTIKIPENAMFMSYCQIRQSPFNIMYVYPQKRIMLTKYSRFIYGAGILAVALFLLFPTLVFTTNMVIRPLQKLAGSMDSLKKGNLDAKVYFSYKDEIGRLGTSFNEMAERINDLVEQTYLLGMQAWILLCGIWI